MGEWGVDWRERGLGHRRKGRRAGAGVTGLYRCRRGAARGPWTETEYSCLGIDHVEFSDGFIDVLPTPATDLPGYSSSSSSDSSASSAVEFFAALPVGTAPPLAGGATMMSSSRVVMRTMK